MSAPPDQAVSEAPDQCLEGGGEMGALMRARDWSQTPLGPTRRWPQSLRTTVSLLLNSRYPMFLFWGPELVCLYNDAFRPSLGAHKHPQALGQHGVECWREIWDFIGPQIEGVMQRGERTWHEDQLVPFDRNGYLEEIYFTYSYSPVRDERGVGGTLVVCSETTARVFAERRLRTLRDLAARAVQAKEAEQALRLVGETLAENPYDIPFALLYRLDDEQRARLVSATGIAAGTRASPEQIDLNAASDAAAWPLAKVLAGGQAEIVADLGQRFDALPGGAWPEAPHTGLVLPVTLPGQQSPDTFLLAGVSPRKALDPQYRDFFDLLARQVGSVLAEVHAYQEERRRAEALAELDRAKTAFFSNISHELRTPLTLLLAPAEDALADTARPLAPLQRERVELIQRNARRLLRLVNTLLDFSRIEAGRMTALFEPTDLARFTEELASVFRSAGEQAGLRFEVDCPPLPEPVYVDRQMWEKIVLNLLSNAFKFTFEGAITTCLRWRQDGAGIELEVCDTGIGIEARYLPRLFDRFHRVRGARARSQEGSGIGLALVRELVKLHGGQVAVSSSPGKGTRFTVSLPGGCAHLPPEHVAAAAAVNAVPSDTRPFVEETLRWLAPDGDTGAVLPIADGAAFAELPDSAGVRILVADDNADLRDYLSRLLGSYWTVETAADGARALRAARRRRPDLILADVMMPALDGFALLRALRADPDLGEIPIILLSARAGEEARVEGLRAGADDYLVKPFSARELMARIGSQIALKRTREQAAAALRQKEQAFRTLAEHSPDMVARYDRSLRYLYANPTLERLSGRKAGSLIGKPCSEIGMPAGSGRLWEEKLSAVFTDGKPLSFEFAFHGPRRRRRYYHARLAPELGADGTVESVVSVANDISERVESERVLKAAQAAAEAANRSKSEFLANMSHEIRTPMSAILGYADILAAHTDDPDNLDRIETIRRNGWHLLDLINDILDLSKIEAGRIDIEHEQVPLATLLSEIHSLMAARAQEKGLEFGVEFEGLLPETIESDPRRLRQILINLVGNAVKFTERGAVSIKVRFMENADPEPQLAFAIADTGPGITKKQQQILFQPFIQVDSSSARPHEGSGLGLAISCRLAELLGGTITLDSRWRKGSTFTLTVPTGPVDGVGRTRPQVYQPQPYMVPVTAPLPARLDARVLVVDDLPDNRYLVQHILEQAGAQVATADGGHAALTAAARAEALGSPFDAVVMDMQMPDMDGYNTTRKLRAQGFDRLIVALTAGAMKGEREKCLAAGCNAYLSKPIDGRALVAALADAGGGKTVPASVPESDNTDKIADKIADDKPGCRVLIVDDNRDAATALAQMLTLLGYDATAAFDGCSALALARAQRPRVVVLDINLPDISGFEVAEQLRQESALADTVWIALSGEDIEQRQAGAFHHCLLKPVGVNDLVKLFPITPKA